MFWLIALLKNAFALFVNLIGVPPRLPSEGKSYLDGLNLI